MDRFECLSSAACLANALPDVTLVVALADGEELVVSSHRIDAAMDPSRFRTALITASVGRAPRIHEVITGCEVADGAIDLGGGLYRPAGPTLDQERWFTTVLSAHEVRALAATCPVGGPDDAIEVVAKPDLGLGVCAVRCAAPLPRQVPLLHESAFWLLSACIAEELITSGGSATRR